MSSFDRNYNTCHYTYDLETMVLWVGVAYSGGSAFGGGLIAQLGIEIAYIMCVDNATNEYADCFNDALIL